MAGVENAFGAMIDISNTINQTIFILSKYNEFFPFEAPVKIVVMTTCLFNKVKSIAIINLRRCRFGFISFRLCFNFFECWLVIDKTCFNRNTYLFAIGIEYG